MLKQEGWFLVLLLGVALFLRLLEMVHFPCFTRPWSLVFRQTMSKLYGALGIKRLCFHCLFNLGVNSGASKFSIEQQAVNEATFCCPDELGWQPLVGFMLQPIFPLDGGTSRARKTSCSTEAIQKFLKEKGYNVIISDDAGRFVCNYVYYHSLRFAEQKGHKSLFVHVPPFSRIDEKYQMCFAATLLEAIGATC